MTAPEIDAALERLAELDAYRVVFVDGVHAPELSAAAGAKGSRSRRWRRRSPSPATG